MAVGTNATIRDLQVDLEQRIPFDMTLPTVLHGVRLDTGKYLGEARVGRSVVGIFWAKELVGVGLLLLNESNGGVHPTGTIVVGALRPATPMERERGWTGGYGGNYWPHKKDDPS